MKKIFAVLALFAVTCAVSAQEVNQFGVRIPSGYQGNVEYSNLFYFKDGKTGMMISTTHGFFYTSNLFVGMGIGVHVAPQETFVPVFAAAKYVVNHKKISPVAQFRMGSFFNEGAKPYMDLGLGLRFASDRDFAFSIMAAGSYYTPFDVVTTEYHSDSSWTTTTERRNLSCLSIRLGIEW